MPSRRSRPVRTELNPVDELLPVIGVMLTEEELPKFRFTISSTLSSFFLTIAAAIFRCSSDVSMALPSIGQQSLVVVSPSAVKLR